MNSTSVAFAANVSETGLLKPTDKAETIGNGAGKENTVDEKDIFDVMVELAAAWGEENHAITKKE